MREEKLTTVESILRNSILLDPYELFKWLRANKKALLIEERQNIINAHYDGQCSNVHGEEDEKFGIEFYDNFFDKKKLA